MSQVTMTIEAATAAMQGTLLKRGTGKFEGVAIDSRQIGPGQCFVAIPGAQFDGHDFCAVAVEAGATLLVVSRPLAKDFAQLPESVSIIQVGDTRKALGALAHAWRRKVNPRIIAVTGSVGKTTTKELIRNILGQVGPTHSTAGNFNNDFGLPLTLLTMDHSTQYLVVEMGMSALGEITYLAQLAEPQVGLITCIAPAHLETLGSLEVVAKAKGELLMGLQPSGWAVIPGQEPLLEPYLKHIASEQCIHFGSDKRDEVRILGARSKGIEGMEVLLSLRGECLELCLPLVGMHNAQNAAAAAAATLALGVPYSAIQAGLSQAPQLNHRSTLRRVGPFQVLDDCYNANPVAMKAALDTVVALAANNGAPAVAVLGHMLELGPGSKQYHQEVGRHAAVMGLNTLFTVGSVAEDIAQGAIQGGMASQRVFTMGDIDEVAQAVIHNIPEGAWILVKASRGARLEGFLDKLVVATRS